MIDELKNATVSYTGNSVTVLFRDRDKTGTQLKIELSNQLGVPVQFVFQTGSQTRREWWYQGIIYNPFGPSSVVDDQHCYHEIHTLPDGRDGRDGGPANITHRYQKSYREKWINSNGAIHRSDGGPAIIEIDYGKPPVTTYGFTDYFNKGDLITYMERRELVWIRNGKKYCDSSWARQVDNGIWERIDVSFNDVIRTTVVLDRTLFWYDGNNELHRSEGPAYMKFKHVKETEKNNKHGKWKYKGWTGSWYVHGREINDIDIIHWARKNNIRMWDDACYDKSAFRDADGEFCFLTDFAGS